jgi:dihydrofolate synthase/folylpolyglutamate synthase
VEFAVLEVGMGGRLDATNVTEPRVAIITNIDLDHEEYLGSTHAAIAHEKAGVIKPGRPVISACGHPEAAEVIRRRCAEVGAGLIEASSFAAVSTLRSSHGYYAFDLALNGDQFSQLRPALLGKFQLKNAVAAATAAWRLGQEGFNIPRAAIAEGLAGATWPGRLEVILKRPLVLLDGAHNPAAAREVAAFIHEHHAGGRVRLVYASMRDKAIGPICETLFPLAEEIYLTRPENPRAASAEEILAAARCRPARILIEPEPGLALDAACRASAPEDIVLAAGSLFLVGAIKKALLEGKLTIDKPLSR